MLKILSAAQIRELDAYTIKHGSIASIDLMGRACLGFTRWFIERFDNQAVVGIVCGSGNNGGDALGIARLLQEQGYPVQVWVVGGAATPSVDFTINLERAQQGGIAVASLTVEPDEQLFRDCTVLIDGLFGSGLSRPPVGVYAQVINRLNDASATIVAIDIPSGLMADSPSPGPVVKADFTVSFQLPKLAFFLPQCHAFVGRWFLVDIGLNKDFIKQVVASHFQVTKKDSRKILRRRSTFGHKGNFGHALLVAGSYGKMGAAVLASRGALRAGLGLLTTHIPRCGYDILQSSVPEAMTTVDSHQDVVSGIPLSARYNTIAIGPGLGTSPETVNAFRSLLEQFGKPMVIDADGLNILSENRECMHLVAPGSILTPHPGEFERLVGNWKDDFERLEKQKQLAHELKSVVVLKGAFTSIATPDGKVFFNSTGNPGMATGGSGDVLTGILAGFMAQGYEALHAALLGVYLHGLAGDLAAVDKGVNSLIASDIVNFLPSAFLSLRRE